MALLPTSGYHGNQQASEQQSNQQQQQGQQQMVPFGQWQNGIGGNGSNNVNGLNENMGGFRVS